jgi:hypothetical protein
VEVTPDVRERLRAHAQAGQKVHRPLGGEIDVDR